ncbi:T6SS phospholipase effector Tle1-like catalytic domain-containing protein [Zobellia nedashkovskayae]|uniref:T6SS phospholipase effector Tle1-like catalytic domain-containing protein n=1 Tax=Zobellia nedashkovskayae TaxID=2779510 RepID=UPI00188AE91A|nr:DUF2235 domain-containing protein [Zobellia nedashkovskayae]
MSSIKLKATEAGAKETKNVLKGVDVKTAKVHVSNTSYRDPEEDESIDVTIGVFFDGTGNNKYNTEARELNQDRKERKLSPDESKKADDSRKWNYSAILTTDIVEIIKNKGLKKEKDGSYENDLSNVARLYELYNTESTEKDKNASVYIEGIGTNNGADDDIPGSATGMAMLWYNTGIRDKVKKGCEQAWKKIKSFKKKQINTLTIDVYGFSRGAAAARNFVHEIHKEKGDLKEYEIQGSGKNQQLVPVYFEEEGGLLGEYLKADGIEIKFAQVRFIGLFDSVASHGFVQHNDAVDLGLDSVKHAKHTFHLASADEHRTKFSLTDIRSAGSRGIQKFLPGVHSDIGGCYLDGAKEKNIGLNFATKSMASQKRFKKDKKYLIDQGWYTEDQLTTYEDFTDISSLLNIYDDSFKLLVGNRDSVSNKYSYIPLNFMHKQATDKNVKFKPASEYKVSDPNLIEIEKRLYDYVFGDAPQMDFYKKAEDRSLLKKVRNKHFHFSSDYLSIGMNPQWEGKERAREIYLDTGKSHKTVPLQYGIIPYTQDRINELVEKKNKEIRRLTEKQIDEIQKVPEITPLNKIIPRN